MMDARAEAQFQQMQRAFTAQQIPRTVTAAATVQLSDYLIACDASGGAFTLTLPTVADARGMSFLVVKTDSSANAVTIDGAGSETINGATTLLVRGQWHEARLYCDGTRWYAAVDTSSGTVGTFTPALTFGGGNTGLTFSTQAGRFQWVSASLIDVYARITLSAKGSSTGAAVLTGLPLTARNDGTNTPPGSVVANLLTFSGIPAAKVIHNTTTMELAAFASGGALTVLDDTAFANTTTLIVSFRYEPA